MTDRRTQRVASVLREAIQSVLDRGLHDPRIAGLVTVTAVRLAADLRQATVSVSVLPHEREHLTLQGLNAAAAHIRHQVAEAVALRYTPVLRFRLDAGAKRAAATLAALARIAAEQAARQTASTPPHRAGTGDHPPGPTPPRESS